MCIYCKEQLLQLTEIQNNLKQGLYPRNMSFADESRHRKAYGKRCLEVAQAQAFLTKTLPRANMFSFRATQQEEQAALANDHSVLSTDIRFERHHSSRHGLYQIYLKSSHN